MTSAEQTELDIDFLIERGSYSSLQRVFSATTPNGGNRLYETALRDSRVGYYRALLRRIAGNLGRDSLSCLGTAEAGERLGDMCFYQLLLASSTSVADRLPTELIEAAVRTGYRSAEWGEAAANQYIDSQPESAKLSGDDRTLSAHTAMLDLLAPGTRIEKFKDILDRLPKAGYTRDGPVWWTDHLAPAVPDKLLPELMDAIHQFPGGFEGNAPRSLAIVASRFPEPRRSEILAEALTLARQQRNTWGHAATLIALLPQMAQGQRQALADELLEALGEGALGNRDITRLHEFARLADMKGSNPRYLLRLIRLLTVEDDRNRLRDFGEDRDMLLGEFASRTAARGDLHSAYLFYTAIESEAGRLSVEIDSLAISDLRWRSLLARPAGRRAGLDGVDRWLTRHGWLRMPESARRALPEQLLARVLELDDDQASLLYLLHEHLPPEAARQAREIMKSFANTDDDLRRAEDIADLVQISPPDEARMLLDEAFALVAVRDEDERERLVLTCDDLLHGVWPAGLDNDRLLALATLQPEDGAYQLRRYVDHLPAAALAVAWDVAWSVEPNDGRLLAQVAGRMAEVGDAAEALRRLDTLLTGLENNPRVALLERLPRCLRTTEMVHLLLRRWDDVGDEGEFWRELHAVDRMRGDLPDEAVHDLVTWHRLFRKDRPLKDDFRDEVHSSLAPLYARAGALDEAKAMAATIAAHHERSAALAGIAEYLPEPERTETARAAHALLNVPDNERVWSSSTVSMVGALAGLVGADPGNISDLVASDDPYTLGVIARALPAEEARNLWEQAVGKMDRGDLHDFLLDMPTSVVDTALARAPDDYHADADDSLQARLFDLLGEKGPEVQVESLARFLTDRADKQGRAMLVRDLQALAPLLHRIGGDVVITRIRDSVEQVGKWWP